MTIRTIVRLCRPKQWIKNLFVLLPAFFSGMLFNIDVMWQTAVAFLSFCLASSAVYCLNDLVDAQTDRLHPEKCRRPVAAGEVGRTTCLALAATLATAALALPALLPTGFFIPTAATVLLYLLLNVAYCLKFKRIALVDVITIAIGFVLRVFAGGSSTGIFISHWIILMTFLLALFLALSKRRDDIVIFNRTGVKMRQSISRYNLEFINQASTLVSTAMLVCYIMYSVSPEVVARMGSDMVYVTSLFVVCGLLRYTQLSVVDSGTGSPTQVLLHDRFLQICVLGWVLSFAAIIYL